MDVHPTALLEQPSPSCAVRNALGRRNIALLQDSELNHRGNTAETNRLASQKQEFAGGCCSRSIDFSRLREKLPSVIA